MRLKYTESIIDPTGRDPEVNEAFIRPSEIAVALSWPGDQLLGEPARIVLLTMSSGAKVHARVTDGTWRGLLAAISGEGLP